MPGLFTPTIRERFTRTYVPRPPKKALRKKKIKEVLLCTHCKCRLDPRGNLNGEWTGKILCNRCARKLFYRCPRCKLSRSTSNRGEYGPHRTLCDMCNRLLVKNAAPPRVRDVYWGSGEPVRGGEYTLTGSNRTFGVEIETAHCMNVHKIEGKTVFGAKYDATVTGREFDSPILSGDAGLKVVTDFCDHATRRGWAVDSECGIHVHLGMQDDDIATVKRIGYAFLLTYDVWEGLVAPERRRGNRWCMKPPYTPTDYRGWCFQAHCESVNRYHFFNFNSYCVHKTIEVRALQGTLDKTLISNWVCALVRFADFAATSCYDDLDAMFRNKSGKTCWKALRKHIGSTARYWGRVRADYMKR